MKISKRRFWVLFLFLIVGAASINAWELAGEASVSRNALSELPEGVGAWRRLGADERFSAETESVLRADDYLSRNYVRTDGHLASFYVGYYASQKNGATYHSPLNCLPGSGWTMAEPALISVKPIDGSPAFDANRYVIGKGNQKFFMVYWYEGRGRKIASEYWGKIYTVVDSARLRRSDGAMVRVMVPITSSEAAAEKTAVEFASQVAPLLSKYIPN